MLGSAAVLVIVTGVIYGIHINIRSGLTARCVVPSVRRGGTFRDNNSTGGATSTHRYIHCRTAKTRLSYRTKCMQHPRYTPLPCSQQSIECSNKNNRSRGWVWYNFFELYYMVCTLKTTRCQDNGKATKIFGSGAPIQLTHSLTRSFLSPWLIGWWGLRLLRG